MAKVIFEKVIKRYPSVPHPTVRELSLTIDDGEFLVLVGPSGCGKSTVLRMLAGLISVTGGRISIDGKDVTRLPPKDRDISMVFQNYALFPHLDVYENIAFGLKIRGVPKKEIHLRVMEAAALLGIEPLLQKKPRELSGGQSQRVAVGRAIVRRPKVFLFDEPLSNLDAKMRTQMRAEISRLHRRLKSTAIYVTHDQCEAMTMADRLVVLHDGVIGQCGTPHEIYSQPRNTFVATFIGSPPMNLFPAEVVASDGPAGLKMKDLILTLPPQAAARLEAGHKYTFGIRPEHIYLAERASPGVNVCAPLDCEVELAESMGNDVVLHCNSGGLAFQASLKHDFPVKTGDRIKVVFAMDKSHIFGEDGERLVW